MPRNNYWESDFITGEISPRLAARADLQKYSTGVQALTNFIVQLQGGVAKRSGTIFASRILNSAVKSLLIPFTALNATAYVIEMANNVFRFFVNHGLLVSGGVPVQVATPYTTADLPLVDYAQSADTLFLTQPNYAPQQLQRTSTSSFSLTPFNFQDGPYMSQNADYGCIMEHSGFTQYLYVDPVSGYNYYQYNGNGTITASGTVTSTGAPFAPFVATDVGRWIRILQGTFWGAVKITAVTSSTVVQATALASVALGDSGKNQVTINGTQYARNTVYPTYAWRLGSWSNTTGWPSTVNFYQGRLCFANTRTEPQGFWTSESGVFNLFSPTENNVTVEDSDGIGETIASNQLNSILWLLSGQALLMGTFGAEWAVLSPSTGTPISPSAVSFQQQSAFGSKKIRPYLIGVSAIYVQRSGKKLREMTYDWSINGWRSIEISMLSEHLFREGGGITQAAYQQEPNNIWWGCRADGMLIGMSYVKEQSILGFHKHVIGGSYNGGNAVIESVCCIPTPDGTQDQLWMIVCRTINGQTARYVEYMDVPFDESTAGKNTMNFVDCGVQTANFPVPLNAPISRVTGLDHLIGQMVSICADGSVQPQQVVANDGSVTLTSPASLITIGLPYVAQLATLSLPIQGEFGTSQGAVKRIDRVIFRIDNSLTFKFGKSFNDLENVVFGTTNGLLDNSPPLFTGDKPLFLAAQYDMVAQICIQSDAPYPLHLLGMSPQLVVQGK